MSDEAVCPACRGDGEADAGREAREMFGAPRNPCRACDGTGRMREDDPDKEDA